MYARVQVVHHAVAVRIVQSSLVVRTAVCVQHPVECLRPCGAQVQRVDNPVSVGVWWRSRLQNGIGAAVRILEHVVCLAAKRTQVIAVHYPVQIVVAGGRHVDRIGAAVLVLVPVKVLALLWAGIPVVRDAIVVGVGVRVDGDGRDIGAAVPVEIAVVVLRVVGAGIPPVVHPVRVGVNHRGIPGGGYHDVGAAVRILEEVVCLRFVYAQVHHIRYTVAVGVVQNEIIVWAAVMVVHSVERLVPGWAQVYPVQYAVAVGVRSGPLARR